VWFLGELLVFGALGWLLLESIRFVGMGARQVSAAMEMRLHYVYAALPAAVILAIVNRARQFVATLIAATRESLRMIGPRSRAC
jgi:TRAP-type C4-dicarboxylate transport system permease small subunit